MVRRIGVSGSIAGLASLVLVIGLAGCNTSAESNSPSPIVFAPGLGMSALAVEVDGGNDFSFLVPVMTSPELLPASATSALEYSLQSGLAPADVDRVQGWLSLVIEPDGSAVNASGVSVKPVSVGEDFGAECPQYVPMAELLTEKGWEIDTSLRCLPYDYRYPPGENSFAADLQSVVTDAVADANGQKAVVACHSQGCLMADHALRTLDPDWVADHVLALYGFAGQYSGCSDCMAWAFGQGWSWDIDTPNASPVDPTWVGQLALDLQSSVYSDSILYTVGEREFRATDTESLLRIGGAEQMARATSRYGLQRQEWFATGDESGVPLSIPARFVYGIGLPTTIGYAFAESPANNANCSEPTCVELSDQVDVPTISADGDGGDSTMMNAAPSRWTKDPGCEMRELPGVTHFQIVTDALAIDLLVAVARPGARGEVTCVGL